MRQHRAPFLSRSCGPSVPVRGRKPALLGRVAALTMAAASPAAADPLPAGAASELSPFSAVQPVAVFGTDDRVALPAERGALSASIGLLYEGRSRSVCTAFCVGDAIIATAGHCLFKTAGERAPRLKGFSFRLQPKAGPALSSRIAGADKGAEAQHVASGAQALRIHPPIDAAHDWALVRLKTPICKGRALPISRQPETELVRLSAAQRVYQVGYHRDFGNWELGLGAPCAVRRSFSGAEWKVIAKDFVAPEQIILHTCDTGGASSGSPMLMDGPSGPEVVGINVGTYLQARVLTQHGEVVHRYKSETVANTAVGASAFRSSLEALARADIVVAAREIRELQRLLGVIGHFSGVRDGRYGPKLNAAIRSFERAEGRPETGLATASLLRRLVALEAERRGRPPAKPKPPAVEAGRVGSHDVSAGK